MDDPTRTSVARRATGLSFIALFLAVFLGAFMLGAWQDQQRLAHLRCGPDRDLHSLAADRLGWGRGKLKTSSSQQTPAQLAVSPLAFPGIVTPRAVGVLIIFVAFFPTLEGKLTVLAVAGLMLLLNLLGMRYAHWFMQNVGMTPLLVLGAVFGVLQVALGIEMMANGWRAWAAQ